MNRSAPLFAVQLVFLGVSLVGAGGWYVDATRPDNKGDGRSESTAWKSVGSFVGKPVAPGDTLYLKRGSRWENSTLDLYHGGSLARPFVVTAYGDPALPLPVLSDTSSRQGRVLGVGASHVVVERLAIHAPNGYCVTSVADSLTDLVLQDLEVSDCQSGIGLGRVDGALIVRNKVENIHFPANLHGGGGGAIGITLDGCRHVKVLDNIIRDAIDGKGDQEDGGAVELFRGCSNIEIAYNRARHTAGFLEMGGLVHDHDTDWNVVVHHNIVQESQNLLWCSVATAQDTSNEWGMAYREVYVDHNTQIQDGRKAGLTVGTSLHLEDSTQIRVRNNLFVGDSQAGFLFYGPFERRNNLFWSKNFPSRYERPYAPGELATDPHLVADTGLVEYVLPAGSPARDAGAILSYPATLGGLASRPIPDGKPDIGALEMASTSLGRPASRLQGELVVSRKEVRWRGWAIAAGTLHLRLMEARGRTIVQLRAPHGVGLVDQKWSLPPGAQGGLLDLEMDGFHQTVWVL